MEVSSGLRACSSGDFPSRNSTMNVWRASIILLVAFLSVSMRFESIGDRLGIEKIAILSALATVKLQFLHAWIVEPIAIVIEQVTAPLERVTLSLGKCQSVGELVHLKYEISLRFHF